MKIKLGIGVCCFFFSVNTAISQINYGTTGLMNLPTADMQRDKTFLAGGNWDTRPFPLITAITPAIGYRLLMASSPTRTVLSIFVYGYGKKGGGRNGLHRW